MIFMTAGEGSLGMRYARAVEELTGKRDRKALLYSMVPDCLIPFFCQNRYEMPPDSFPQVQRLEK